MSDVTPEDVRKIAREEIGQHEEKSEESLKGDLGLIHLELKQIKDSIESSRDHERRIIILEGQQSAIFKWKDASDQLPEKKLNRTATIIGIIATVFTLLTSAAMIAVFRALVSLGGKL